MYKLLCPFSGNTYVFVQVYDYYDVIHNPMDLSTVMKKIDERCYQTAKEWLQDIDLITRNALE